MKIYTLKVKEVKRETADAITIRFENPGEKIFYKSGQFVTLILNLDGKEVRRSYSLNSSPFADGELSVSVKAVPNGLVSNYLNKSLTAGTSLQVIEPMGNFVFEPQNVTDRPIVLVGAGSGITPLFSILKTILYKEPSTNVALIYGNRNKESIIYYNELEALNAQFPGRLTIVHTLSSPDASWVGYKGRINQAMLHTLIEKVVPLKFNQAEYFVCGPHGVLDETLKALDTLGVAKEKIHKESFTVAPTTPGTSTSQGFSGKSRVTVIDGKKKHEFEVDPKYSILETAMKLGINLPYSCQSGMCTACMGKCTTGKVAMNNPDGLTDGEIARGYVLTCIGHPASPEVVIEL